MMHAQELLLTLRQQGFTLKPLPEGKLEIRPASRLTPELRAELKQRKAEVLALLTTWTCRYCSNPLTIDDVCPSLDGERMLTLWRCDPCEVAGVTPDAIKKPPVVWVKTIKQ